VRRSTREKRQVWLGANDPETAARPFGYKGRMDSRWANFYVAVATTAAALTGLLFVAVALRPHEIRTSALMVGRARSAFYAFVTVLLGTLLALFGTSSRLVGLAQVGLVAGVFALSVPYTVRAWRARTINYRRAVIYDTGLAVVAAAGAARAVQRVRQANEVVFAVGVLVLRTLALSNSARLVTRSRSSFTAWRLSRRTKPATVACRGGKTRAAHVIERTPNGRSVRVTDR
jgi:hypothetical protein